MSLTFLIFFLYKAWRKKAGLSKYEVPGFALPATYSIKDKAGKTILSGALLNFGMANDLSNLYSFSIRTKGETFP